jgi:hypothetical protein
LREITITSKAKVNEHQEWKMLNTPITATWSQLFKIQWTTSMTNSYFTTLIVKTHVSLSYHISLSFHFLVLQSFSSPTFSKNNTLYTIVSQIYLLDIWRSFEILHIFWVVIRTLKKSQLWSPTEIHSHTLSHTSSTPFPFPFLFNLISHPPLSSCHLNVPIQ